jgi:hypothetical protein
MAKKMRSQTQMMMEFLSCPSLVLATRKDKQYSHQTSTCICQKMFVEKKIFANKIVRQLFFISLSPATNARLKKKV